MLNVAMLSFAHVHAKGYADRIQENPRSKLAVVWDEEEYGGKERAAEFGVPFEPNLDAVLSRPDIDAVCVAAPSSMHSDLMVRAARAGKHIFTEKVLALTVSECDEIIREIEKAGVKFTISLPQRGMPDTQIALRAMREGWLGKVGTARLRTAHPGALDGWFKDSSAWFHDPQRAGGGALYDLGCHAVDLVRALMGKPVSVIGRMTNFVDRYPIDDNSAVIVEFENGGIGIVDVTWVHRSGPGQLIELYGTEGHLIIRRRERPIELASKILSPRQIEEILGNLPEPKPGGIDQWVDLILDGTPTELTLEVGRDLTELMQAVYLSQKENRAVSLPL